MTHALTHLQFPNEAGLFPGDQVLLAIFLGLPTEEQIRRLRVLQHWDEAPAPSKALALKLLNAELTDEDVARLCQRTARQLRRYDQYRQFARLLRATQQPRRVRGRKDRDGGLGAWTDDGHVRRRD